MRREKDIVGPEQGGTLRDLGVSLPPGVQAHRDYKIINSLNTAFRSWKNQAAGGVAVQFVLPINEQVKKEQELREQVMPLIEKHDLAHAEEGVIEQRLSSLQLYVVELSALVGNPFLDQDRIRDSMEGEVPPEEAEIKALRAKLFLEARKAIQGTDAELPSWLQEHQR